MQLHCERLHMIFAKSFNTSLLTLSWDTVLPTHKTNTYHFRKVSKLCLFHIKTKTSAVLCVKSTKANWHQWSDKAQILKREGLLWMLSQQWTFWVDADRSEQHPCVYSTQFPYSFTWTYIRSSPCLCRRSSWDKATAGITSAFTYLCCLWMHDFTFFF